MSKDAKYSSQIFSEYLKPRDEYEITYNAQQLHQIMMFYLKKWPVITNIRKSVVGLTCAYSTTGQDHLQYK